MRSSMRLLSVLCLLAMLLGGCLWIGGERFPDEVKPQSTEGLTSEELRLKAIALADSLIVAGGYYDLSEHRKEIVEDSVSIVVEYVPVREEREGFVTTGGGCMYRISKKDLTIIESWRYQ